MNTIHAELEVWKDIPGYEGLYEVSNLGNIKSLEKNRDNGHHGSTKRHYPEKILRKSDSRGYTVSALFIQGKIKMRLIHRLVALAFIPNPLNKPEINHLDGDRKNNRVSNLEWVTRSENIIHKYQTLKAVPNCSKPVLDLNTGVFYDNITQAYYSKPSPYGLKYFRQMVSGRYRNSTSFQTV